jgi:hypothetical protein
MNKISITTLAAFFTSLVMMNSSNAVEVNLGPFSGNLTTTVSQGFQVRASDTACELNSGAPTELTGAQLDLIGAESNTGNGGCDKNMTSSIGTSTKVVGIGSVNSDDGRNNYAQGDFTSISSAVSLSYTGSSDDGMGISLSASGLKDSANDVNEPSFKRFSSKAQDHFETNLKIGNAYVTLPMGNTDFTIGRYIQSQGVSALFPIGVNVVNPVSLPIIRAPGTLLRDALLPQGMVGFNSYLGEGISVEGYYQLEQEEVELDAAGSFFGSDIVGVGNANTGLLNAPYFSEQTNPSFSQYYDIQSCMNGGNDQTPAACGNANLFSVQDGGLTDAGTAVYAFHAMATQEGLGTGGDNASTTIIEQITDGAGSPLIAAGLRGFTTGFATNAYGGDAEAAAVVAALFDDTIVPAAATISDAEFLTAYRTLAAHGTDFGLNTSAGLVDIKRAGEAKAKSSGQFGLNFSGYAEDIGTGLEWGLYYNNSHSNTPRVRMLGIQNLYATELYGLFTQQTQALMGGTFNLVDDSSGAADTFGRLMEQVVGNVAYGPTLCGTTNIDALAGFGGGNPVLFSDGTYLNNPANCYTYVTTVQTTLGAASPVSHAVMVGGAVGAIATLGPINAARYQTYYPEDIQTMGLSLSTNIGPTTMNVEVAYRPEFPFQIAVPDLVSNLIDSTGGSLVQSHTQQVGVMTAADPLDHAVELALAGAGAAQRWSSVGLCDLSSTGNASLQQAGYNFCDGTAEFDAYTFNVNFIRSLAPSNAAVVAMSADSGSFLLDIGAVSVPDLDYSQGVVAAGHFSSGHDILGNGCMNSIGTNVHTPQANALFGNGYCDDARRSGASDFAVQYKIRTGVTYNNINNSQWSMSPSLSWDHGVEGNAPSSLGGWTEDSYQLGLSLGFANQSGMSIALNYTDRMGEAMQNSNNDKDTVSASLSYAF